MGLLGFGTPNTQIQQPVTLNQPPISNKTNGGFSLLGDEFLGIGSTQPTQQAFNINPAQNTGFSLNQTQNQNQGFNWGS